MAANPNTIYKIRTRHNGHEHIYEGTLRYLIDSVFGYTLECNGTRWPEPKTAQTLVNRLNGGRSYWSMTTSYEVVK